MKLTNTVLFGRLTFQRNIPSPHSRLLLWNSTTHPQIYTDANHVPNPTIMNGQPYCRKPTWSFTFMSPICLQDVVLWHQSKFSLLSWIWEQIAETARAGGGGEGKLNIITCTSTLACYKNLLQLLILFFSAHISYFKVLLTHISPME
jgi:hypothetical protein